MKSWQARESLELPSTVCNTLTTSSISRQESNLADIFDEAES